MMNWRQREVDKSSRKDMRWTILPPEFYECLVDSCSKSAVGYANGKMNPYPSFTEVDVIFFPLCIEAQDWALIRVDLKSMGLMLYYSHDISSDKYRAVVHPKFKKINVYLTYLLVHIRYWKNRAKSESVLSYEVNDAYVQPYHQLIGNEGIYVCMLMEHLVTGKELNIGENFNQTCMTYRRFMADQFYFWRCLPRPV